MSHQDDIEKLSKQFLELWQKQLSASFRDPGVVGSMLEMMQTMQQNFGVGGVQPTHHTGTSVSGPSNDATRELNERLDAIEKRIDKLESGAGKGSRKAGKASAKSTKS